MTSQEVRKAFASQGLKVTVRALPGRFRINTAGDFFTQAALNIAESIGLIFPYLNGRSQLWAYDPDYLGFDMPDVVRIRVERRKRIS